MGPATHTRDGIPSSPAPAWDHPVFMLTVSRTSPTCLCRIRAQCASAQSWIMPSRRRCWHLLRSTYSFPLTSSHVLPFLLTYETVLRDSAHVNSLQTMNPLRTCQLVPHPRSAACEPPSCNGSPRST